MDPQTDSLWPGVLLLLVFLGLVFLASRVLNTVNKSRFKRALDPLVPIINGKNVGGSFDRGWMEGRFAGRLCWVVTQPNLNAISGQTGHRYNSFTITLKDVKGGQNWSLQYGFSTVLEAFQGKTGWYAVTEDPRLRARLEDPALLAEVEATVIGWGRGRIVTYTRYDASLMYEADVTPNLIPTETQFRAQLALLLRLAAINEEINPG